MNKKMPLKKLVMGFVIAIVILFVGNLLVEFIKPFVGIPDKIMNGLGMSFGFAYLFSFNMDLEALQKTTKVSRRQTFFIAYFYTWLVVASISVGLYYIF